MAVDKKIKYEDQPVIQGGVQNYLGKQPQVMAPRKWQSSPDKPATELAYITKAEKDLILKANIHGGLEKGPNMGPSGIMSLDSFGDADAGVSGGLGGGDVSDAETGRSFAGADTISDKYGRDLRAGAIAAGGRERLNEPQSVLNQVKALQKQFGPRVGTSRFGFLNPSNIFSGIMGLINPALGLFTRGFDFLKGKAQDLRGYNPDGTPRTQQQYEDFMAQKSLQNRFDKLMDRKLTGKNYSQKNLESLMNMGLTSSKNSLASALARDLEINPEMPQFATSYLGSLNKGITNTTPGMDFAAARRAMTQPTTYTNTPFEGARTVDTYRGVDPYKMNYLNRDLPTSYRSESLLDEQPQVPSANTQDYDFFSNAMAKLNKLEQKAYDNLKRGKELGMNNEEQNKQLEELEKKKNEASLITGLA